MYKVAPEKIRLCRTMPFGTGSRGVLYLPHGHSVHTIEDDPIPRGTYFLTPDNTGKFMNWVIEYKVGTRTAVPPLRDDKDLIVSPGRVAIEVHKGNTLRDTDGCICPGMRTTATGVMESGVALSKMRSLLRRSEDEPPVWVLEVD